jgi:flagellar motor protein MotB
MLSGCGGQARGDTLDDQAGSEREPVSVVFVVGAHANAPQIQEFTQVNELMTRAAATRGYVAFVAVDGSPQVFDGAGAIVGSDAPTQRIKDEENAAWVAGLNDLMANQVKATTPETDTLEALRLAARALSTAPEGEHHIVVIDSGLSTAGVLSFMPEGMLFAVAEDVVNYLNAIDALIAFEFGTEVDWYSLGDVAEPQAPLTTRQRANLEDIWGSVIMASGAEVNFHANPSSGQTASGLPAVSVIDIEPEEQPEVIEMDEPVIFDESVLHFVPGYADLIDPEAARKLLAPYAQQLADNPDIHIHVVGTTAGFDDTPQGIKDSYDLSWSRAGVVTQLLIELGAPAEQVTPEGQAHFDQWHLPEIDENGVYHPELAAQNRKVVLVLADSEHGCIL